MSLLLTHRDCLLQSNRSGMFQPSLWVCRHDDQGHIGHHGYKTSPVHGSFHAETTAPAEGSHTSRECRETSRRAQGKNALFALRKI